MLITRQLSQEDTGRYFSLLSFVSIFAVIAGWGMSSAVVRLISRDMAEARPQRAAGIIQMAFAVVACTVIVVGALLAAPESQALVSRVLNLGSAVSFTLVWLWIVVLAFQTLIGEIFRGFHNIMLAALFGGASSALLSLAALSTLYALDAASLNTVMASIIAAVIASVIVAGITLRRRIVRLGKATHCELRALLGMAAPMWFAQLMLVILLQADIWILQSTGDASAVALYGAAARMTLLMTLPLTVLNAAMMPLISAYYTRAEHGPLQVLLRGVAALATVPALVAIVLFVTTGPSMLALLFGDAYSEAAPILVILGLGQLVNVLSGSPAYTLMMTGRQSDMMWITFGAGLLAVVAGLMVVGPYGAIGLACASAAGLALQSLGMWVRVRQVRGIWTHASWQALVHPLATLRQLR